MYNAATPCQIKDNDKEWCILCHLEMNYPRQQLSKRAALKGTKHKTHRGY